MIIAGAYPITVRRGDTGTWTFKLENLNYDQEGNIINDGPIDITDWQINAVAKWSQDLIWFEFPINKLQPTLGVFQFYIDKVTSENLLPVGSPPPDVSSYEVQAKFTNPVTGNLEVATIMEGKFTVIRDLIRDTDFTPAPLYDPITQLPIQP